MSIKRIFIVISAIFAASAVFADNSSVTSKKYVDDLMSGYQGKLPGSGANKLMIYDDETGIGEKAIETTLVSNATGVPTVGAVKTGLDGVQDTITGTAGYVMTGTGTPGEVGEKPIYSANTNYSDALVTAETVNNGVINAVNHSLRRVNENGESDNNGTLWEIADTVVALTFLPAGYTQLEYIQSTGTQYIDTGLRSSTTTVLKARISWSETSTREIFGANGGFFVGVVDGYWQAGNPGNAHTSIPAVADTWYDITYSVAALSSYYRFTLQVGNQTATNDRVFSQEYIYLFTIGGGSSISAYSNANNKLAHVQFYQDGALVRDMIPAKRDSDSKVGMYDIVNDVFYTDISGGNFIAGPSVAGN